MHQNCLLISINHVQSINKGVLGHFQLHNFTPQIMKCMKNLPWLRKSLKNLDPLGVQMYYFPQGHLQHVLESIKLLFAVAGTMIFTGLHTFKLAGASLSMAFVNVTGFSVISGLGMAMDGITSQAFGARNFSLMARTLHQTILILLCG
ncbi:multidrug and toxin extrusion protein 1 [Artemisia annua]|uniref:Multidrug and toxin extrusion protein 1 n=1 Tax=Artemisia annua TaxID=35608 RepID=A0A2U1N060_ARTAN|nr:multidrug and toxin extrusion protein 1 [Artemisia annua]